MLAVIFIDPNDSAVSWLVAPVRAERFMQPAKSRRVFALKCRVVTLAMILVAPGPAPKLLIVGGHHATFTTGREDLVLAK